MSFASYMLSQQESAVDEDVALTVGEVNIVDESGFFDGFGVDKLDQPSKEGLDAALDADNQFVTASDGKDTDVDLSTNTTLPDDVTKEANSEIPNEEEFVDPATVPNVAEEKDQFAAPDEDEVPLADTEVSVEDLAKDDDIVGEAFTGWDDLF